MQKYKEKPIHLVSINDKQMYCFGEEAQSILSSVQGKIAIVAVAGMYRTGKSYLLNRMLLNRSDGFGVGPTINPCTKGLWMWGKPIVHRTANDQILNVFIVDSEGLGACQQDNTHDSRIFALTMLLSSCFIYNSMGSIDENAISSLGLVVNLGKYLRISAKQELQDSQAEQYAPDFFWVIRDFVLQLVNKEGNQIDGKQYLENALGLQVEKLGNQSVENRNAIRKAIKTYFPKRDCITLIRPLTKEENLQMLEKMEFQSLRPEFVEQVLNLRKTIFGSLKAKTLKGKHLNGKMFCQLVGSYVDAVNKGGVPVIENTWNYICRSECEKALDQAVEFFEAGLAEKIRKKMPLPKEQLRKLKDQLLLQVNALFTRLTPNNDFTQQYKKQLLQRAKSKFAIAKAENQNENIKAAQQFLTNEFQYIDRRVKNNEYKRISEYVKQLQLFYDYYKKKCPQQVSKANIYVLEFLIKRFAETAVIMAKHAQNQTEGIKAKLKEIEFKAEKDLQESNDKATRQRVQFLDKIAVTENMRNEMQHAKEVFSEELEKKKKELETLLQEKTANQTAIRRETSKAQNQLKIQLQRIEQAYEDKEKQHTALVSGLQRQAMLLQNKVEYTEKNLQETQAKWKEAEGVIRTLRADYEKGLKQADKKSEALKNSLQLKISKLELSLQQRNSEISRLQQNAIDLNTNKDDLEKRLRQARQQAQSSVRRLREQSLQDRENQMERVKRENQQNIQEISKKIKKLEAQTAGKESTFKGLKLQLEKEVALATQKLNFCQSELEEKNIRITKMNQDYENLMNIISSKDEELSESQTRLIQIRDTAEKNKKVFESESNSLRQELSELKTKLEESTKTLEQQEIRIKALLDQKTSLQLTNNRLTEQLRTVQSSRNQTLLERELKFQEQIKKIQMQLEAEKEEGRLRIEQIKRNGESSLVQLKNFYEIEKQRLEKRLLEERRRLEQVENEALQLLAEEYSRYKESAEEELVTTSEQLAMANSRIRSCEQQSERQLDKLRISLEEVTRQKNILQETFEAREQQARDEIRRLQKQQDDQRATFLRKVENITHEMSRKEKQLLQLSSRREGYESQLQKKDQIIEELQRDHAEQLQHANICADEYRAKYISLKDEFMELKIESEKEIALTRQKNQFLASKVAQLIKQRELSSSKVLIEKPNDRNEALREQLQKTSQELQAAEAKFEKAKKAAKDNEAILTKQLVQIEREKTILTQKLYLTQQRNKQLQSRASSRGQQHMKDIEQMRERYAMQRQLHTSENQKLRSQLSSREAQYDELYSRHQRQTALLDQKLKFIEYQRQQMRRELDQSRKKLEMTMAQLQKRGRMEQEQQLRRQSEMLEKKYLAQIETLKEQVKRKAEEGEDTVTKFRMELRAAKERITELQEKLLRGEKSRKTDQLWIHENQQLKKERDELFLSHKAELARDNEESRKKMAELEKKYKAIEKKNAEFNFVLEKEHAKWTMEKDGLLDRITELEQIISDKAAMERSIDKQIKSPKSSIDRRLPEPFQVKKSFFK